MIYKNVLFDLDGTLTDPREGITKSVQYALAKCSIIEEDLDKLEPFIGPPLKGTFMQYYDFSEEKAIQAVEDYREYFKKQGKFENEVYQGIPELLQALKKRNACLFVATSKPTVFAKEILEHFKLDTYFDGIFGSELDGTRADKTELIAYLLREQRLDKSDCVMIGDRKHDIIGARNNQIASIAVEYGYGNEQEWQESKPDRRVQTVEELHSVLV